MSQSEDPAFPSMFPGGRFSMPGITVRQYYAAHALIGILGGATFNGKESLKHVARLSAEAAFVVADAMLLAQEQDL